MADYNINVKYQSGGKTGGALGPAGISRSKAIQASKGASATGTLRPDDSMKKLLDSNAKLATGISKLNKSIDKLTSVVGKNGGGLGGGGGSSPENPGGNKSGYSLMGMAGAASLGGIAGFLITKIGQIGDAYMQRAGLQRGSSGIGGFKYSGVGNYMANDIGAMNKAYRMASGDFSDINALVPRKRRGLTASENSEFQALKKGQKTADTIEDKMYAQMSPIERDFAKKEAVKEKAAEKERLIKQLGVKGYNVHQQKFPPRAEQIEDYKKLADSMVNDTSNLTKYGTVFGIDANELGTQAGNITRGGGDINKIVSTGMSMGQNQEMPNFMSYISSTMEEAITAGMSNWSKPEELANDIAGYIALSDNKSAKFATGMINKSKNSQVQASKGKVDSYEGLNTWFASQDVLMSNFKTKEDKNKYLDNALNSGKISPEQYQKALTLKEGASYYDLTQTLGQSAATYLTEDIAADPSNATKILGARMGRIKGQWGSSIEAMQSYSHFNNQVNGTMSNAEIRLAYKDPSKASLGNGEKELDEKYSDWNKNGGGMAAAKDRMLDNMVLNQGKIAAAALEMETALYTLATTAAKASIGGIEALSQATSGLAERLNNEIKGTPAKVESK